MWGEPWTLERVGLTQINTPSYLTLEIECNISLYAGQALHSFFLSRLSISLSYAYSPRILSRSDTRALTPSGLSPSMRARLHRPCITQLWAIPESICWAFCWARGLDHNFRTTNCDMPSCPLHHSSHSVVPTAVGNNMATGAQVAQKQHEFDIESAFD